MSSRNTIIYGKEVDFYYERKKGGGGANCLLTFLPPLLFTTLSRLVIILLFTLVARRDIRCEKRRRSHSPKLLLNNLFNSERISLFSGPVA